MPGLQIASRLLMRKDPQMKRTGTRKTARRNTPRRNSATRDTATALLKTQHKQVEAVLKKLEGGRSEAQPLLEQLARALPAHMQIEQELFYPAVREVDEDVILESFEEHSVAEIALKRLLATPSDDPTFKAKVTTLKELVLHHAKEEESELLPKADKKLPADQNRELGRRMKEMFEQASQQRIKPVIPEGGRTTADVAEQRVLREMESAAE
jgi:hemerythrin superfamily protein